MNKRGLFKFILLIVSFILTFIFYLLAINFDISSRLLLFGIMILFTVTLFMYYLMNKIKTKYKFTYDVILLLLTIASISIIIYISIHILTSFINETLYNVNEFYCLILFPIIFINIVISIHDLKNDSNKVNDLLGIATSLIIIITVILFLTNSNLNLKNAYTISSEFGTYNFLIQNYIYYAVMYSLILIHKLINKH